MSRVISISLLIVGISLCCGCTNVEGTAEKVFTNANDAIKPENNSIWWEGSDDSSKKPHATATPAAQ